MCDCLSLSGPLPQSHQLLPGFPALMLLTAAPCLSASLPPSFPVLVTSLCKGSLHKMLPHLRPLGSGPRTYRSAVPSLAILRGHQHHRLITPGPNSPPSCPRPEPSPIFKAINLVTAPSPHLLPSSLHFLPQSLSPSFLSLSLFPILMASVVALATAVLSTFPGSSQEVS